MKLSSFDDLTLSLGIKKYPNGVCEYCRARPNLPFFDKCVLCEGFCVNKELVFDSISHLIVLRPELLLHHESEGEKELRHKKDDWFRAPIYTNI